MLFDARIPVVLADAEEASAGDVLLAEGDCPTAAACFTPGALAGHPPGCACCAPRNEAGRALSALLQDRARGRTPFFYRVVVATRTPNGRAEVEAALACDPVASSCFRLIIAAGPAVPARHHRRHPTDAA